MSLHLASASSVIVIIKSMRWHCDTLNARRNLWWFNWVIRYNRACDCRFITFVVEMDEELLRKRNKNGVKRILVERRAIWFKKVNSSSRIDKRQCKYIVWHVCNTSEMTILCTYKSIQIIILVVMCLILISKMTNVYNNYTNIINRSNWHCSLSSFNNLAEILNTITLIGTSRHKLDVSDVSI